MHVSAIKLTKVQPHNNKIVSNLVS